MSNNAPFGMPPFAGGFQSSFIDSERLATINRLQEQDAERVATINRLQEQDAERVATIIQLQEFNTKLTETIRRLQELDAARIAQINNGILLSEGFQASLTEMTKRFYESDGLISIDRNLEFMDEPVFAESWMKSKEANREGWPGGVPDVRWRAAISLWAARHALHLKGDFVECGVHTGLLSLVILNALGREIQDRKFYLFDTFNGIPLAGLGGQELEHAVMANKHAYSDVWEIANRNFAPFKNAFLVRGELPSSLAQVDIGSIAYLQMDLNVAAPEMAVMKALWENLVPGAIIVIDDYAWLACKAQYDAWNEFAKRVDHAIAPLPTGQGLLIKR